MVSDPCVRHTLKCNRGRVDSSLVHDTNSGSSTFRTALSVDNHPGGFPIQSTTFRSSKSRTVNSTQISFALSDDSLPYEDPDSNVIDSINALVDRVNTVEYRLSELEGIHRTRSMEGDQSVLGRILSILYRLVKQLHSTACNSETVMIPNGTTDN